MTKTPKYALLEPAKWTHETPTAGLRWKNGMLQQAWQIKRFIGGSLHDAGCEWRDIPTVDGDTNETGSR